MAQEKLLLRKGLHADLISDVKCPIVPGAISITTDEPGIYIDLAADATHNSNYRVRIGDFIRVADLDALASEGQKHTYSANALYYAEKENVLCKYDSSTGKFVWINNTSDLREDIDDIKNNIIGGTNGINAKIVAIETDITAIEQTIGTRGDNNAATNNKTVFEAIEAEYARATQIESGLSQRIDDIVGEGEGSIGALEAALQAETSARTSEDTALGVRIDNLAGTGRTTETVKGNADAISTINNKLKNIEDKAEVNIIEVVKKNGTALTVNSTDRSVNITMSLSELTDGASVAQSISDNTGNIIKNTNAISDLNKTLTTEAGKISKLQSAVGNKEDGTGADTLYGRIAKEAYDRQQADNTLQNNINTLSGTVSSNKTDLQDKIDAEAQARTSADNKIREDFAKADQDLKTALEKYVNDNLAIADAMTFKGTVSYKTGSTTELNLPIGNEVDGEGNKILVHAGDTYVVATNLSGSTHTYHAGDMLIAKADQKATDATYTGGWEHVKTGYDVVHESKLSVLADNGQTSTGNKIVLTSHVGSNLGSVEFTSSSSNIAINKTAGNTGTINFDLVWATF